MNETENGLKPENTGNEQNEQIHEIDVRLQEISVLLESYEYEIYEKGTESLVGHEEYANLKKEYKTLKRQRGEIKKSAAKSVWDTMPIWMAIYAILQYLLSIHYIMPLLSVYFAAFILYTFPALATSGFMINLLSFSLPFLSILTSVIILLLLKEKKTKKIFLIIFLIHLVEILITTGLMLSIILKS